MVTNIPLLLLSFLLCVKYSTLLVLMPWTFFFGATGVILSRLNQTLTILRVKEEVGGLYTCTACNSRGCDTSQSNLITEGQSLPLRETGPQHRKQPALITLQT